jgi:hypothetical protein
MAKIKKEKFKLVGKHIGGRTTSHGAVELYSYYNVEHDFFLF